MHTTRFIVEHVRRTTVKPFDEVRVDFERRLGGFDACEYQALAASENAETARAKIEAMAGTSAFGPNSIAQDAILFLEIVDDIKLLTVHPPGKDDQQVL